MQVLYDTSSALAIELTFYEGDKAKDGARKHSSVGPLSPIMQARSVAEFTRLLNYDDPVDC